VATRIEGATAQRGWVGPDAVINTHPIAQLRRFLRKPSQRRAA